MKPTRILVVEDEIIIAKNIELKLRNYGYEPIGICSTGQYAIEQAANQKPDLILMDISIKGDLDGIETAEVIQSKQSVPVIYLTALADDKTFQKAKISQPFAYLIKPFNDRELHVAIEIALYKHQTEREIIEQRQWLSATLNGIAEAVIATDANGLIQFMNPIALELIGWSQEEAMGRPIQEVVQLRDGESDRELESPVRQVLNQSSVEAIKNQVVLVRKDGSRLTVDFKASLIEDLRYEIKGAVLVMRDITAELQAQQDIQANEKLFRSVFESSPVGIVVADEKGYVTRINGAYLDTIPDQPNPNNIIGHLNLLDNENFRELGIEEHFQQLYQGEPFSVETEIPTASKSTRIVRFLATPLKNDEENVIGAVVITEDVTERHQFEIALRESEERYRLTIENMPSGVLILNLAGNVTLFNRTFVDTYHLKPNDIKIGQHISELPIMEQLKSQIDLDDFLTNHTPFEIETQFTRGDGEQEVYLHVRGSIIRVEEHDVSFSIILTNDITSIKYREETLRALKKAIETMRLGVTIIDLQGTIIYTNPAEAHLHGYDVDELIGQHVQLFAPPELRDHHTYENIDQTKGLRRESINIHKNGRRFPVLLTSDVVVDEAGNPIAIVTTSEDITERKQTEERIQEQAALLDIAPDAILVQDLDEHILYWNKGAEQMFGWTADEVIGKKTRKILYQDALSGAKLEHGVEESMKEKSWQDELTLKTKDGRQLIVESRWTLMTDEQDKPRSILVVNTDVTEKKQMQDQFFRAQRLESIGTLAGGVAHDLNNVLAPILLSSQLLRRFIDSEETLHILDSIEKSAKRGANMVKQILMFAKGIEGVHAELNPRYLIKEIISIVSETFPKSIHVDYEIPESLWTIHGDSTQLHQVLMNLCVNARDAMPSGGHLIISAKNIKIDDSFARMTLLAKPGPHVMIAVSDTGVGMSADVQDKLFDPFFTTKEVGKGTGLGLSTTMAIIKSHNGFITVESELGSGTTFKIYMPTSRPVNAEEELEEIEDLPTGNAELILIVDDEEDILEVTQETLELNGYQVVTASDGTEALAQFAQHKSDVRVVLIDMAMPILDGPTTIRALFKMDSRIKIIATSGLTNPEMMTPEIKNRIKAFLPKPFSADELIVTIASVIHGNS